jgi:hypothetical protein
VEIQKLFDEVYSDEHKTLSRSSVDFLIQKSKDVPNEKSTDFINLLANVILENYDFEHSFGWEELFKRDVAPSVRLFVAVCLLRLWKTNSGLFRSNDIFRYKSIDLFDNVFNDNIYKNFRINPKDQGFEKENKLLAGLNDIENSFTNLINSISNLLDVKAVRHEYLKNMNSSAVRILIQPFLPQDLVKAKLPTLFQLVEEYLESEGIFIIDKYQKLFDFAQEFASEAIEYNTHYTISYLYEFGFKVHNSVQSHFESSPIGQPGNLIVEKVDKKYPLSHKGEQFQFSFLLKNIGPGQAFKISCYIDSLSNNIRVREAKKVIGNLSNTQLLVEVTCEVIAPSSSCKMKITVNWDNTNNKSDTRIFECSIHSQRSDIPWEKLNEEDPYSLEPVSTDEELVGRSEIINQLMAQVQAKNVGSSFLFGQKRVGKTSIVKTLTARLNKHEDQKFVVIYLEGGTYISPDPTKTIVQLGKRICKEIINCDRKLEMIKIPDFDGDLSSLSEFLEDAFRKSGSKFIIILDEFDELHIDLFKKGPVANSFFLTIRSISNQEPFGFILVGGEKMEFVNSQMGDKLNKFNPLRIDYFSRERDWTDFEDLIKRPVNNWLEFNSEAIERLYLHTSGNPYFAKLICRSLFNLMISRRDSYVTIKEIDEAIIFALGKVSANSFQHFWDDGITVQGIQAEEISILRRKVLIAFGECSRSYNNLDKSVLIEQCMKHGIEAHVAEAEIRDFFRRQVLEEKGGVILCKSLFFNEWLKNYGVTEIMTTFADFDLALEERKREVESYVRPEEIIQLIKKWGTYQGRTIQTDEVRGWLNQFGNNRNQRLMFKLLQGIKYYSGDTLRQKMKEAHGIVRRGVVHEIKENKRKRNDIIVSYLDGPGKSGSYFAKLYADENQIYATNIIERTKLRTTLSNSTEIKALVFIDDFCGSGNSAGEYLTLLKSDIDELLGDKIAVFFIAVCGFDIAKEYVEKTLKNLQLKCNVHFCDLLAVSDKVFSEDSTIYSNSAERTQAQAMSYQFGQQLEKRAPLGYSECKCQSKS